MNTHDIEEEILICIIDDHRYFLGPEYDGELAWHAAKQWCESLGEGFELPNRSVMLEICTNKATASLLTQHSFYWTSTEDENDTSRAWLRHWNSTSLGFQYIAKKSLAFKVRAVRRCRIEENK